MPADIVNLRRARKAKVRIEKARQADANRVAFGRTKADKATQAADRDRAMRTLEAHRRDKNQD